MALRHPFPETVLPDLRQQKEPENVSPLMKKPKKIDFRPGADMVKLSEEMVGLTSVRISATLGAGKSTKLPRELSVARGIPVVHVVPSRLLAVDLYDYLSQAGTGTPYHLSLSPEDGFGEKGVTLTYSANMIAVLLQRGMGADFPPFGECILYLDECHESDCFTYTLSKLGHCVKGVKCTMYASATHSPDRMPMREADGELESQTFSKDEKPHQWDPLDVGKPWSVTNMPGNTLMYVDSERVARDLLAKYEQAGATAFRLSSKMSVQSFRQAMAAMRDPNSGIIVLIADYSFRSGFTFDVQSIIDSCVVNYNVVEDGKFVIRCRFAYELEKNQAAGRGGRTAGSACVAYSPTVPIEQAICMLEGVEMDAAALIFRYLGYAAPAELKHVLLAKGNVPSDFVKAANGTVPLSILSSDQVHPLVAPGRDVVTERVRPSPTMSEVLDSYAVPTPPMSPTDYFSQSLEVDDQVPSRPQLDGLGFLQELQQMSGSANTLVPGRYYACPGVPDRDVSTRLYGSDWKNACREVLTNKYLVLGLSRADRHELVALLLAEYNRALTVKTGLDVMLQAQQSLTTLAMRYPKQVHDWSALVAEAVRSAESNMNMLIEGLGRLRTDQMRFVPISANVDGEGLVAQQWAAKLEGAIKSLRGTVDPGKYLSYIQKGIDEGAPMGEDPGEAVQIDTSGRTESAYVRIRRTKVGKKRMIDIVGAAAAGVTWDKHEFKVMLASYLHSVGMDITAVRSFKALHTLVDGRAVLQELRDDPQFLQRNGTRLQVTSQGSATKAKKLLQS